MRSKLLPLALILTSALILSGCYRIPVPQGNILSAQTVSKVRPGMSPSQVITILGTPVLNNVFVNNELAYVYTFKQGTKHMYQKRVIVYFRNNRVTHVMTDHEYVNAPLPHKSIA
jgi:outer membrane protein assembly factor BamE